MKLLAFETRLPSHVAHLEQGWRAVWGEATLRRVHGEVRFEEAGGHDAPCDTRTYTFSVDVSAVPWVLRCFFCGPRLRVTTRQTLERRPGAWLVRNDLKMHFMGSELFRVEPTFLLTHDTGEPHGLNGLTLRGAVAHHARLPPPLAGIAERFMERHSERELRRFQAAVEEAAPFS